MAPTLAAARAALPPEGAVPPWGGPAAARSPTLAAAGLAPGSVANRTPTATKLSQKPGCNMAQGSAATTTAQASSSTCGQGQRLPDSRSSATQNSINTVRCDGTPQPLKKA